MQRVDIVFAMHEVDVQTLNGQRRNRIQIGRHAFKIGGQEQFNVTRQCIVSRLERIQPLLR
ncbi:hypothetical protein D3C75_705980 [compost metagenome]